MIVTDDNAKRTFQQMHDLLLEAVNPTPKPFALGAAISFITTTVILTQQLKNEGRLPPAVENDQKQTVHDWVSSGRLTVAHREFAGSDNNDPDLADLRHLRNCFGHGNWRYDVNTVTKDSMQITLHDYLPNGMQTWDASIEMIDLINLAQRLLVVTFNGLP